MTDSLSPSALSAPLFSSIAMRAIVNDRARLQRMLDFEAALARAAAAVGVIPASVAGDIASACHAERYDIAALSEAAVAAGDIAIPVVAALTAEVAKRNAESAGYVHRGASSQDLIDTALALELRVAIDALIADLDRVVKTFTTLAGRHRRTMMPASSGQRPSSPMPVGLKIAGYAAALARSRERLRRVRREALALQLGGADGTLAALGDQGIEVSARVAALIDLPHPDAPWHSHRDRLADVAATLAILAGGCGKIAGELVLLMNSEAAEAAEPANADRSGLPPPNRRLSNAARSALSAATMAPGLVSTILAAQIQEPGRGLGGWQSESATFPALLLISSGALQAVVDIAEGLEVNIERMKSNLEANGGPTRYQGAAQTFLDRLVATSLGRFTRRTTDLETRPAEPKPVPSAAAESPMPPPIPPAGEPAKVTPSAIDPPAPAPEAPPAKAEPMVETAAAASPSEEPSALIEAFTRVSEAADQMATKPATETDNKPT